MKFLYTYRTSDNRQHRGVVKAASKEAAYAALKAQGIKPGRVEEAPGFFNKVIGKGKRWIAIGVLLIITIAASIFALHTKEKAERIVNEVRSAIAEPRSRHQIYGDPAFMQELESNNYSAVFPHLGDRFLARFAQPGMVIRFANSDWRKEMAESLKDVLSTELKFSDSDTREVVELKQIVLGIREELRGYLAAGGGTCETFVKRMEERQVRENQIYIQAQNELANETDPDVFDRRNESLRRIGLPTISMPEQW